MFYYLDGIISEIDPGAVCVDIGGVGYKCYTSMNTISYLEKGKKAKLYTYCYIKEDAFDIFGFADKNEKRMFELLISVSGVGPKAAIAILSVNSPEDLAMAIISENDKALTTAPGIGKRIAQRVILELKDKISKESPTVSMTSGKQRVGSTLPGSKVADASAALAVLGYSPAEVNAALRTIDAETMTTEEIIKAVLKSSLK